METDFLFLSPGTSTSRICSSSFVVFVFILIIRQTVGKYSWQYDSSLHHGNGSFLRRRRRSTFIFLYLQRYSYKAMRIHFVVTFYLFASLDFVHSQLYSQTTGSFITGFCFVWMCFEQCAFRKNYSATLTVTFGEKLKTRQYTNGENLSSSLCPAA